MPPCENVLMRKIDRTNILTAIIKNARDNVMHIQLTNGWNINENMKIEIEYFPGSPYPADITEVEINSNSVDDDDEEDYYRSESDDSDICDTDDDI